MKFIEEHYAYIHATANAKAVEIARATGMWADVDDFRQDLITVLVANAGRYDATRSMPKTFISACLLNAKKDLLSKLFTDKRRVAMKTIALNADKGAEEQNHGITPPDGLERLPRRLRGICSEILSGASITQVARSMRISPREVIAAICEGVPAHMAEQAGMPRMEKGTPPD